MILNNTQIIVSTYWCQDQLVAVALLMQEGELTKEQVTDIRSNKRRLKNQFIPQSLLTHCGIKSSFDYRYLRIMRIAVHPELQGNGIGTSYLSSIIEFAYQHKFDFVGTSFGINEQLLSFWLMSDFKLARLGFTQDKASGEYSAMLIRPLSDSADRLMNEISDNFYRSFNYMLAEVYPNLSVALVVNILAQADRSQLPELTETDKQAIDDFIAGERQYLSCLFSLHLGLLHLVSSQQFDQAIYPLVSRIIHKKSLNELCLQYGFTGQKQINHYFINYFAEHFDT